MNFTSTFLQASEIHLAAMLPGLRSTILVLALLAMSILAVTVTMRYFPEVGFKVRGYFRKILFFFKQYHHEARLNSVVCSTCRKGKGILDPIYVSYKGIPHIEGTCNCCGTYVRSRLQP